MEARRLKIDPWAKRAGISNGTIRNFLDGRSYSLTHKTLEKLAAAEGVPIAALIEPDFPLGPEGAPPGRPMSEDERTLRESLIALEDTILQFGAVVSPERKADMLVELYRRELAARREGRALPAADVIRLVRNAA